MTAWDKSIAYLIERQEFGGYRLPPGFVEENFLSSQKYIPKESDLFVASFPKSGTTWMQYIVCLIYNKGIPPRGPIMFGSTPFLELVGADGVEEYQMPLPIKTHLPLYLTPFSSKAKYIYVARNPKDTCVSFFHHCNESEVKCKEYNNMTFDQFFELFYEGTTDWNDYFDNVLSWYERRNEPNVMFITYEEMKKDAPETVKKVAQFMGGEWAESVDKDPNLLKTIVSRSSLKAMKGAVNESMKAMASTERGEIEDIIPSKMKKIFKEMDRVGAADTSSEWRFVRKGVIGDWRNHFNDDQNRRLDEKIKDKLGATHLLELWAQYMG